MFSPDLSGVGIWFCGLVMGGVTLFAAEHQPLKVIARVIGQPIQTANTISYIIAPGYGRDGQDLLCWVTTAESGAHFFSLDLTTRKVTVKPLNHLEGYPIVPASDGNIYVGSTTGQIMRFNPHTDEWGALAQVFSNPERKVHHVRAMDEGRDGWLYAGSCYGERARVNRQTGAVENLPPIPENGKWYVSSVKALPDGRIAFGLGHVARLFIYDPVAGKDVAQWVPADWKPDGFIFDVLVGETVLFSTHFPRGRRGAVDMATGKWLGEAPWPPMKFAEPWSVWFHSSGDGEGCDHYLLPGTDTIAACDGNKVYQWNPKQADLPPTLSLESFQPKERLALAMKYHVDTEGQVWVYNRSRTEVMETLDLPQPPAQRRLFALGVGPDGCTYGGAYQSTALFRYNPRTDELNNLGNHNPGWSGETYSFAVQGGELLCSSYTHGALVAYDPAKPWECSIKARVNPRRLGFFGQQVYRPYSTAVSENGRVWAVGAAGWGSTGAGIAWLAPETGKSHATVLPRAPTDVLALPGNQLLVSDHDRFLWWDGTRDAQIAAAALPFPAAGAILLSSGPPPRVAFCSGQKVAIVALPEPGKLRVEATFDAPIPAAHLAKYSRGVVVGGAKGFASVNVETGQWHHFCDSALGTRYAFVVHDDVVYFTQGASLLSVGIPSR